MGLDGVVQYILPVRHVGRAVPVAVGVQSEPSRPLLEAFRWSVLGRDEPHWGYLAGAAVASMAVLVKGAYSFRKMERRFADVI